MENGCLILKDFVEGKIDAARFLQLVNSSQNLITVLKDQDSVDWSRMMVKTSLFDYLSGLNLYTITDFIDFQDFASYYLTKVGVDHVLDDTYVKLFRVILDAQPNYIDADIEFIQKHILPAIIPKSKKELIGVMRQNFKNRFLFKAKPPRWIQNPNWPIIDEVPAVFMEQRKVKKGSQYHDDGFEYIFYHEPTRKEIIVLQLY